MRKDGMLISIDGTMARATRKDGILKASTALRRVTRRRRYNNGIGGSVTRTIQKKVSKRHQRLGGAHDAKKVSNLRHRWPPGARDA